jgi:adenylylsulfate kinase
VSDERGFCLWFTGLSGAGKSTISEIVVPELQARGAKVEVLDGDVVRMNLSKGLGFSKEDRDTNILRIGWVAEVLVRNGVIAVVSAISPYNEARDAVRANIGDFFEVFVKASVGEIAEHRDPKGLYKKALAGEIDNFTGVSDPYEAPENPELVIDTEQCTPEEAAQQVLAALETAGLLPDPVDA